MLTYRFGEYIGRRKNAEFIAAKMNEKEKKFVNFIRLEVTALPEFAYLFKESKYRLCKYKIYHFLDENGKFYQFLRNGRKRTYKEIEDDSQTFKINVDELQKAKKDLEIWIDDLHQELEWFKNCDNMQVDNKEKLEDFQIQNIIDDSFNPI